MPYVNSQSRNALQKRAEKLSKDCETGGDLNFVVTVMLHRWLYDHGTRYVELNKLMGVLECAKEEFYAKVVRPYEDQKIKQNGDIALLGDKIA
jgi:hypothetical protein